ncbi:cytidylyltransferase domain-containing protein [Clostridium tetani]|uniref:cytidylyltransferase domain-containing protein n=1 Tax=Clostridium tetani TaxID=1513 RepID=UPI0005144CD9|nr:glycosyltransferase family protein [Clostridium tetani]KGI39719.1 acylneuraminate cytidylyltransferase [Clostridium tetani ATCC 9441]RXM74404.1 acylneuraminate cytidylyltransferase [Clostridium tetani]SUY66799.1 polysaccharide biosynthesis protein with acetyltransferase domain [Clostridium tetani]
MKVVCIVQARVGSTRLPRKVLKKICEKTVLEHDIDRLRRIKNIDEIIIATTTLEKDNAIIEECERLKVKYFRGAEEDVLSRYYYAAKENNADVVVRVTSDCPLIDPEVSENIIQFYLDNKDEYDYVSNTIERTYPRGLDTEVVSFSVLRKTFIEAKKDYEREHVTPYIYQNMDKFRIEQYKNDTDYSEYRWTLDTKEDFQVIKKIYEGLYKGNKMFDLNNILKFISENPYIAKINENIEQKKLGE